MITFTIHTWRCQTCGYAQDFEPTVENMEKNFNQDRKFKLHDIGVNECPNCRLQGMPRGTTSLPKETDPIKKSTMCACEQSDVDALRVTLEAEAPRKVKTGERNETPDERVGRINEELAAMKPATTQQIQALRTKHEDK